MRYIYINFKNHFSYYPLSVNFSPDSQVLNLRSKAKLIEVSTLNKELVAFGPNDDDEVFF